MRIINTRDVEEDAWTSPKGTFAGFGRSISIALGRDPDSTDLLKRHPFDVEILRIAPGQTPYPYHAHGAQWEFYHVISGSGTVRSAEGKAPITTGDAFVFPPGEAHQLINTGSEDLVIYVVADNPIADPTYYPDSRKWGVRIPERLIIRSEPLEYYDGEE